MQWILSTWDTSEEGWNTDWFGNIADKDTFGKSVYVGIGNIQSVMFSFGKKKTGKVNYIP